MATAKCYMPNAVTLYKSTFYMTYLLHIVLKHFNILTIGNSAKNATTTTVDRKPEINPVTTGPSLFTKQQNNFGS